VEAVAHFVEGGSQVCFEVPTAQDKLVSREERESWSNSWSNSAEICIGCFGKTRSSLNVGKIVML